MKTPKNIKVFLASSITELMDERKDISSTITEEIGNLFQRDDIFIQFKRCDTIHEGNVGGHDQDRLDQLIGECDICLFLFKDKVGPNTRHEFDVARKFQKETNKPVFFVSFLQVPRTVCSQEDMENAQSLLDFKKHLKEEGILWNEYNNLSEVKHGWVLGILTHMGITLGDGLPDKKNGNGILEQERKYPFYYVTNSLQDLTEPSRHAVYKFYFPSEKVKGEKAFDFFMKSKDCLIEMYSFHEYLGYEADKGREDYLLAEWIIYNNRINESLLHYLVDLYGETATNSLAHAIYDYRTGKYKPGI